MRTARGKIGAAHFFNARTAMLFWKKYTKYESDFGKFLNEMKEKKPEIEIHQQEGRAIWWDKAPIDLDERDRMQQSRVNQQAYVYQSK
jgi:hypothetical protein